ncbi:MAG: hypothetical protein LBT03_02270 [Holosporales bacterium]|nr:hypothetical protein [Holosporales bacterium]
MKGQSALLEIAMKLEEHHHDIRGLLRNLTEGSSDKSEYNCILILNQYSIGDNNATEY